MRKFTKGSLETVVEDDDRRIVQYLANGWKEEAYEPKPQTEEDKRKQEAIAEVGESEGGGEQNPLDDKKTNDAISATEAAHAEGAPVDDGLFNEGGEQ